jgi:hypothetical protein
VSGIVRCEFEANVHLKGGRELERLASAVKVLSRVENRAKAGLILVPPTVLG